MPNIVLLVSPSCGACPSAKSLWKQLRVKYSFGYREVDITTEDGRSLGKYFATVIFLALVGGLIVLMSLSLLPGGELDGGLIATNLVGLLLLTGSFAAIGLFVSCLTTHPVVAAVGTLAAFLVLWLINIATSDPASPLHLLSLLKHFESFINGSIAVTDLIYFVLLIAVFLILSIRRLDADRLRA